MAENGEAQQVSTTLTTKNLKLIEKYIDTGQ